MDRNIIYKKAIDRYGETFLLGKSIRRVSKIIPMGIEEIAEIEICLEKIKLIKKIDEKELDREKNFRVARLNSRMIEEDIMNE